MMPALQTRRRAQDERAASARRDRQGARVVEESGAKVE
jgi:hypothetical protein